MHCRQGLVDLVGAFGVDDEAQQGAAVEGDDACDSRAEQQTDIGIDKVDQQRYIGYDDRDLGGFFHRNKCFAEPFMVLPIVHQFNIIFLVHN